jgi:hypothetical protein
MVCGHAAIGWWRSLGGYVHEGGWKGRRYWVTNLWLLARRISGCWSDESSADNQMNLRLLAIRFPSLAKPQLSLYLPLDSHSKFTSKTDTKTAAKR